MNGLVNKLIRKGCDELSALLICWDRLSKEDKDSFSFEQCALLWNQSPCGSPEEIEIWEMMKAKRETLEQCLLFWRQTNPNTPERAKSWEVLKAKAKAKAETFWQCKWLLEQDLPKFEKAEILTIIRAKAKTLKQCLYLWREASTGSTEEVEFWEMVKAKANIILDMK